MQQSSFLLFDTTSSNTGHKTAACISLQKKLDRPLLWLGCRHYVGEIVLKHVWDKLKIEASKSPEITIFQRFKDNFQLLPYTDLSIVKRDVDIGCRRDDVLSVLFDAINSKNSKVWMRGDY